MSMLSVRNQTRGQPLSVMFKYLWEKMDGKKMVIKWKWKGKIWKMVPLIPLMDSTT
jgi:hypothetical protein